MNLSSKYAFKALIVFSGLLAVCGSGLCDVVVNEVELSPPDNATMWVELYNSGEQSVDINGWTVKIEDKPWSGSISLSGVIEPKGFYVAEGEARWVSAGNGSVYLLNGAGTVLDKTPELSDAGQDDFTYGRIPDGKNTNTRADFAFMMASKGRSNGRGMVG